MIDGALPVGPRQGFALIVGNGNQRDGRVVPVYHLDFRKVQAPVKRRQVSVPLPHGNGKVQVIYVKMNDVEFARPAADLLQHHEMISELISTPMVEAQRARTTSDQLGLSSRIAAGKKGHFMATADQFFGKVRDDALGSTVGLWRHALVERCDLCNAHGFDLRPNRALLSGQFVQSLCRAGPSPHSWSGPARGPGKRRKGIS